MHSSYNGLNTEGGGTVPDFSGEEVPHRNNVNIRQDQANARTRVHAHKCPYARAPACRRHHTPRPGTLGGVGLEISVLGHRDAAAPVRCPNPYIYNYDCDYNCIFDSS